MEDFCVTPKTFSVGKRSKKFNCCRDTRKAEPNGQRLKKQYWNPLGDAYCIQKFKHQTSNIDIGLTSFEEQIGMEIIDVGNGISLKNHKLMDKVDKLLSLSSNNTLHGNHNNNGGDDEVAENELKFDEMYQINKHGLKDNMHFVRGHGENHLNCKRIYLAYYDVNELHAKHEKSIHKYKTYNNNSGLNGLNEIDSNTNDVKLNNYIKDKHYTRMALKSSTVTYKQWLRYHLSMPKEITHLKRINLNHFVYLFKTKNISFNCRSSTKDCAIHRCGVRNFGAKSYWTPYQRDDKRDYLEIDLKYNYEINAVSTRGRPLKRVTNKETKAWEAVPGWPIEYVKRYRLFVKTDISINGNNRVSGDKGHQSHNKQKKMKKSSKNNKKSKDDSADWRTSGDWIDVGEFIGNKDSETEKCHILQSKNIIARYVRFVPLCRNNDGFYGRKSMRVGIYGKQVMNTDAVNTTTDSGELNDNQVENKKNDNNNSNTNSNGNSSSNGNKNKKENECELKDREFSNSELTMTQCTTPCVIIAIDLPSEAKNNLTTKNGYGTHVYQGVDCSCRMCSYESIQDREENRRKRRQLKNMANKWTKTRKFDV